MLGVSGSWRHITPGKESLGLGSKLIVPAPRFALRTSGEKRGWKRAYYSLYDKPRSNVYLSLRSVLEVRVSFFFCLYCVLAAGA